jgi:cyclopropane-fatty-acyl-phospholipid synthase
MKQNELREVEAHDRVALSLPRVRDGSQSAQLPHSYRQVADILALADVAIGGSRPWDIRVHDSRFYTRVLAEGSMGLGETYVEGLWDCDALDEFIVHLLRADIESQVSNRLGLFNAIKARWYNAQKPSRAYRIGSHHYDLGEKLFRHMLGETMVYSCAYWPNASTLKEAQEAKLDLVYRKLGLTPGMRVLDIGCGWGTALRHAASHYGIEAVGITVSRDQEQYAAAMCQGLPVSICFQDYRSVNEKFDRIFSLGMFEHVGYKNYRAFMQVVRRCLHDDGLALIHTIGSNLSSTSGDPWLERYIFPNSMLPSPAQLTAAAEGLFVIEDWHNFGADYDHTLICWMRNFDSAWNELGRIYDTRFYRIWKYYLLTCAGSFRARRNQLWQVVLSPTGVPNGYKAPR